MESFCFSELRSYRRRYHRTFIFRFRFRVATNYFQQDRKIFREKASRQKEKERESSLVFRDIPQRKKETEGAK